MRGGRVDRYFAEPASSPRQGPEAQPVNAGRETALTTEQRAGCFVATALAARNDEVTRAITAAFTPALSPEGRIAAQAAASIMAMNDVHYRFTHLVGGDYATLPARLRMDVMGQPGVAKMDFELYSLVVSAVNGCGMCMESHERALRAAGLTTEQVHASVRIAAVVHAVAATLDGETAVAA